MLFQYMEDTSRLIHDQRQQFINPQDLLIYVNKARREVARRSQCVRYLTPISGSVVSISVTASGSGYSSPVVVISPPDSPSSAAVTPLGTQATATAALSGGGIASMSVTNGGSGYFDPIVSIVDSTGSGAAAVASVSPYVNSLYQGQEQYPFSDVVFSQAGIQSILEVKSVAIIYSNFRYAIPIYSFSTYQSMIRQYPFQYEYVPTFGAQLGRGAAGVLFLYPIPSQTYQMEWDCLCEPSDLNLDSDPDVIPDPWTDAVPFFAAYLAYLELQNFNAARGMKAEFDSFMKTYSSATQSGRIINPYGRF